MPAHRQQRHYIDAERLTGRIIPWLLDNATLRSRLDPTLIITQTPFRVSLVGGGLDYPCWFRHHEGLVVGGAINKNLFITARYLPPFHEFRTRLSYSRIETVMRNSDIEHRAIRACIDYLRLDDAGLEISHLADLPGRSGTGSSSSFVVGLLHALASLQGRLLLPHELAGAAMEIEQQRLNETVGCQDQIFAAHGGLNTIRFRKNGEMDVYPFAFAAEHVEELESHLMLFFTKLHRTSSDVADSYAGVLGERKAELFAMARLAEEAIGVLHYRRWERLGQLIDQSWRIKSGLSEKVTTPAINLLYARARLAGAWGGKVTGAGGGGMLLLCVPPEKHEKVAAALAGDTVRVAFRFQQSGSSVIFVERDNLGYRST